MGYYKEQDSQQTQKTIQIPTHKILPILTLVTLMFSTLLFLVFSFMVGTRYNPTEFPGNPSSGNEFHISYISGLWEISERYAFGDGDWYIKNISYGLSFGGITSMIFIIISIILYVVTAIKLNCGSSMKSWFIGLSCMVALMLIIVVWSMVHQYVAFPYPDRNNYNLHF